MLPADCTFKLPFPLTESDALESPDTEIVVLVPVVVMLPPLSARVGVVTVTLPVVDSALDESRLMLFEAIVLNDSGPVTV